MPPVKAALPSLTLPLPLASESTFSETMPDCAQRMPELLLVEFSRYVVPALAMAKVPVPVTCPKTTCAAAPVEVSRATAPPVLLKVMVREALSTLGALSVSPAAVLPLKVMPLAAAPKLASEKAARVPELMLIVPEKVLAPESKSVPVVVLL